MSDFDLTKARELIKSCETLKLTAYKADKSEYFWTIGWGHYGGDVFEGQVITKAQADKMLETDIALKAAVLDKLLADCPGITENQYNALLSFVYNVGTAAFADSTMYKLLKQGDFAGAAAQFERWNKCGGRVLKGLVTRRAKERALFESTE